jgi:hypothetical protein
MRNTICRFLCLAIKTNAYETKSDGDSQNKKADNFSSHQCPLESNLRKSGTDLTEKPIAAWTAHQYLRGNTKRVNIRQLLSHDDNDPAPLVLQAVNFNLGGGRQLPEACYGSFSYFFEETSQLAWKD